MLLLDADEEELPVVGETSVPLEGLRVGAVYVITVSEGVEVYLPVQPV